MSRSRFHIACIAALAALGPASARAAAAQASPPQDSVSIRIQATDLPSAVQILGQYLDRPVIFAGQSSAQVTFDTPRPVARVDVLRLLRGIVETHGFEVIDDSLGGLYRVRAKEVPRPPPVAPPAPAPATRRGARGRSRNSSSSDSITRGPSMSRRR